MAVAYRTGAAATTMDRTGTGVGKLIVGSGDDGSVQINASFAPNY